MVAAVRTEVHCGKVCGRVDYSGQELSSREIQAFCSPFQFCLIISVFEGGKGGTESGAVVSCLGGTWPTGICGTPGFV